MLFAVILGGSTFKDLSGRLERHLFIEGSARAGVAAVLPERLTLDVRDARRLGTDAQDTHKRLRRRQTRRRHHRGPLRSDG